MNARDLTALVHLVGFTTGIMLYGMLGVMTRRRLSHVSASDDPRFDDRMPLVAAVLGVIWNAGAMVVFAARDFGAGYSLTSVAAIAYAALGFLPAVVVQSNLRSAGRTARYWLLGVAYAAAGAAAVLHLVGAAEGEAPSRDGLLILTFTYIGVLAVLAVTERGRPGFQRTITAVALAAFAVSALHLSRYAATPDRDSWPMELIGHHASLPLVLAILYQDYRFAFADVFLKRALALLLLVGLVSLLYASLAAPLVDPHAIAQRPVGDSHLLSTGALLALWIVTALSYPLLRRAAFRFVDRVILRRTDYREFRSILAARLAAARDVNATLDAACESLARALGAAAAAWYENASAPRVTHPTIVLDPTRTQARISIPTALAPAYEIRVSELRGGRSLLSDDLMLIDASAASIGRRIDEIRLEDERRLQERREAEMKRLAAEAELRALRAQLNPHFLFNALNTLGHLIQTAPDRGLATLYKLTGLLRAVLRRTNGEFVTLHDELDIVESYLAIERERFQERLLVSIDVSPELRLARIPPLVVQPLVENAVKHGIAPQRDGGRVTVRAWHEAGFGDGDGSLRVSVIDTGRGTRATLDLAGDGVGLANIEDRLRHYFGARGTLSVQPTPGGGTTVELRLPWLVDEPLDV
jgi:signal transduction histidine kinase